MEKRERVLTEKGELARALILARASRKRPVRLFQFDAFYMPEGGDSVMHPNEDGWALMGGQAIELFSSPWDIRVFVRPQILRQNKDLAAKALRSIADWVEKSDHLAMGPWLAAYPEGIGIQEEALEQDLVWEITPIGEGQGGYVKRRETVSDGISSKEIFENKPLEVDPGEAGDSIEKG